MEGNILPSFSNKDVDIWRELIINLDFPGGSGVKNPPALQETQVPSLGWEEPPEKEMATQPGILTWEIPQTEDPTVLQGGDSPWGHKTVRQDWATKWQVVYSLQRDLRTGNLGLN